MSAVASNHFQWNLRLREHMNEALAGFGIGAFIAYAGAVVQRPERLVEDPGGLFRTASGGCAGALALVVGGVAGPILDHCFYEGFSGTKTGMLMRSVAALAAVGAASSLMGMALTAELVETVFIGILATSAFCAVVGVSMLAIVFGSELIGMPLITIQCG